MKGKRSVTPDDDDRIIAAAGLVGRTGATSFEIGYLHDGVPNAEAGWFAFARYKGARITVENQMSPPRAAEALAVRLLTGAKCMGCGKLVALSGIGAFAFANPVMTDGTIFTYEQARSAGLCRWKRTGNKWGSECGL